MIYRCRTYRLFEGAEKEFNDFFHQYLLPNQLRHGAVLIGRWIDESKTKITAIWKYESYDQYERIEQEIKRTELHRQAQLKRCKSPAFYIETHQEFWEMTGHYQKEGEWEK